MTATPSFAPDARGAGVKDEAAPANNTGPFVLNLCSSTTPMALAQTDLPELKRFNFFVSRRFEEGRERFRLHMGYFATLAEAEEWLALVREIYPGAWAGEAPGRKLRERAAAEQASQARHAAGPQPQAPAPRAARPALTPPAPPAPARAPAAAPPESLAQRAPVLKAAPPAAAPQTRAPAARPAPPARPAATKPAPPKPAAARPAPASPAAPRPQAAAPARPAARSPAAPVRPAAPAPAAAAAKGGVFDNSNVREVLQALGDASATGETRLMRAPPPPAPAKEGGGRNSLSDTQVLKLLETRRAEGAQAEPAPLADPAHGAIPMLKPDDTGTREALKDAVSSNAPVLFAVQLQWSVQPVELDKVPPLAIFSAYTLYTVEGSRDGRKWYGLRLGFFSDAISAKQVAHYVRSEFASVAVVPVSAQEKSRATDQDKQAATLSAPAAPKETVDEFKLIDDDTAKAEVAKLAASAPAKPSPAAAGKKIPGQPVPRVAVGRAVIQPGSAAPAAARGRGPGKVGAREKRGAQSLEETLEILGASELSIDNGRGETLNESGVRHLRVEVQKNSPFGKLLERLSEKMKKP